jgi:hypothetical protein
MQREISFALMVASKPVAIVFFYSIIDQVKRAMWESPEWLITSLCFVKLYLSPFSH